MAVTIADLAVGLRLSTDGTGLATAQETILARLQGVAEAHIDLLAPDAPEAVKDEAIVQFVGYLYDVPTAGRRDAYANSFVNSGAGSLLVNWTPQAASGSTGRLNTSETPETPSSGGRRKMPSARYFRVPFKIGVSSFIQLQTWTAQQFLDNIDLDNIDLDGMDSEVSGTTEEHVSEAAPVMCYQVAFEFPTLLGQYEWSVLAVADGEDPPTHFRLGGTVQPDSFDGRWRQAPGQALDAGVSYDIYWYPVVVAAAPVRRVFEWPLS